MNAIKRAKFTFIDGSTSTEVIGINVPINTVLKKMAGDDKVWVKMGIEYGDDQYDIIDLKDWHVDSRLKQQFKILYNGLFTGTIVEFF